MWLFGVSRLAVALFKKRRKTVALSVTTQVNGDGHATIHVSDSLSISSLGELRRAVEKARREGRALRVNLAELTLADRLSVQYLANLTAEGAEIVECPTYIAGWIAKAETK